MMASGPTEIAGRRVLVVEDDYMIAYELRENLEELGVQVIGPVPTIAAALEVITSDEQIDGATLDVTLGGENAFPVADALTTRLIPFVFTTGYDEPAFPERYRRQPRCTKPAEARDLIDALFG